MVALVNGIISLGEPIDEVIDTAMRCEASPSTARGMTFGMMRRLGRGASAAFPACGKGASSSRGVHMSEETAVACMAPVDEVVPPVAEVKIVFKSPVAAQPPTASAIAANRLSGGGLRSEGCSGFILRTLRRWLGGGATYVDS